MSVITEEDPCNGLQRYIPIFRTQKCKDKITAKEAEEKAKRDLMPNSINVTTDRNLNSTGDATAGPATAPSPVIAKPSETAATGAVASTNVPPSKMGGWFSRGGKRRSKAKKSRRKNRKQRKSRKSRK